MNRDIWLLNHFQGGYLNTNNVFMFSKKELKCKNQCLVLKMLTKMGYIARNIITNAVFFSKGSHKIAKIVGCNHSTITKFFSFSENRNKDKVIKGWIVSEAEMISNQTKGKSMFSAENVDHLFKKKGI